MYACRRLSLSGGQHAQKRGKKCACDCVNGLLSGILFTSELAFMLRILNKF